MGMFKWFSGLFGDEAEVEPAVNVIRDPISSLRIVRVNPTESHDEQLINPATGQPMVGGASGFDVLGNLFGVDMDDSDTTIIKSSLSTHDDLFDSSGISEIDSFDGCGIDDSLNCRDDW
ncbi:MAG: hypothetical protein L3J88_05795 [Gammaproteobacteria bacterium]|nr:hypothetical protein [Gammaproteobacteria bacterium]MCF6362849.1 hypothetical protein [Gammaproteobacteria bacterium]